MVNDYQENYITGWVKLYRSFIKWEWFEVPNMVTVFIYCLLKANHTNKRWRGVEIKKGTFITSLKTMSKETHLSMQQIRTCLKHLEKSGEINKQSNKANTIITICKYDSYQSFENKLTHQLTNEQHTANTQLTTTNNNKNIKKLYSEQIFLEDWVKCRKHYLKKPTHIKKLDFNELNNFNNILLSYTSEEIKLALHGLFKQQNKNISSMYLKPKHFLENFDKYYNAELSKDYSLYGTQIQKSEL